MAYREKHSLTFEQLSAHFDISMRSLMRWSKNPEPNSSKNRPAIKLPLEKLKKDVEEFPDDYQWERAQRFGVTQPTIHHALKKLNKTDKKNTVSSKS